MSLSARYAMNFILLFMISVSFSANAFDAPKGVVVISAPEVRNMVKAKQVLLVHTLSRIEFQMQHIPGSINIPVDEIKTSSKMPVKKNAPIIFYCNGMACPYSKRAAKAAVQKGYTQIYWFRGGILEWRKFQYSMVVDKVFKKIKVKKLSPEKFRKQVQGKVLVLDVRPRWWRKSKEQAGIIEGTNMMIPLLNLDKQLNLLPKDRPILLVDRLMRQTVHAAKFLKMKGFNVIGVLKGGAKRWVAEGLPVLKKQEESTINRGL